MGLIKLLFVAVLLSVGCNGMMVASRNTGALKAVPGETRIEVEVVVNASLADVWHAWTTNEGVRTFFARDTNIELAIGGAYEMFFDAEAPAGAKGSEGCKVLSYLPNEMLSFSWNAPPKFVHARGNHTWVVVRLEKVGDNRAKVRINHLGWDHQKAAHPAHADEWDEVRAYFAKA